MNTSLQMGIARVRFVLHSSICISKELCNIARDLCGLLLIPHLIDELEGFLQLNAL